MSAAEKIEHEAEHEGAANNADFFDNNFEQGGLLPLIGRIGSLALGVVAQAPIDAVRGRGDAAHATPHAAAHDPHKKEHDKKDEAAKEGEAGHPKKEGGPGHGDAQEHVGDLWAVGKSFYDIYKEAKDGKMDKHTFEHAISHTLDALNLGLARPLAGVAGAAAIAGMSKVLKIREHALAKVDPLWDTLGRQILTGLTKDKAHGYQPAVEGLCHAMQTADIEDNFSKFLDDGAFEAAMKTEKGREALQKQLGRILGQTDQPHLSQVNKRIDAILEILSIKHEHKESTWDSVKGFFGFKKAEDHGHGGHGHGAPEEGKLDDTKAQERLTLLREILNRMKTKSTEGNLTMIYEGKKQKIDYDKFGDQVDEAIVDDKEGLISFMSSFQPNSFKNKFKGLIESARVKTLVATENGRKELHKLLVALFDLEEETKLTPADLDNEIKELIGAEGKLKQESVYPEGVAKENYKALKKFIDTITTNLTTNAGGRTYLELIYNAKKEDIDYDTFGKEVTKKTVDGEMARLNFLSSFQLGRFQNKYKRLLEAPRVAADLKTENGRSTLRKLMFTLFDLDEGEKLNGAALEAEYKELFGAGSQLGEEGNYTADSDVQKKYKALKGEIDKIKSNLLQKTPPPDDRLYLDLLYEDVIQPRYADFGRHVRELQRAKDLAANVQAFSDGYNPAAFKDEFPYLLNMDTLTRAQANETERVEAQRQLLALLGLNIKSPAYSLVASTLDSMKDFIGAAEFTSLKAVLTEENVKGLFERPKIDVKWEELGQQIINLDAQEVNAFLLQLKPALFMTKFLDLKNIILIKEAATNPTQKTSVQKMIAVLYGLPEGKKVNNTTLKDMAENIKGTLKTSDPSTYSNYIAFQKFIDEVTGNLTDTRLKGIYK